VDLERSYACIECGELVPGYKLINHLEDTHKGECAASACAECGYESSSQWKVRLHISVKHAEKAADVAVEQREQSKNPMIFLHKFFSEVSKLFQNVRIINVGFGFPLKFINEFHN
jgi:DNA-directed RNA polymerase subunit RPC12/RpoP